MPARHIKFDFCDVFYVSVSLALPPFLLYLCSGETGSYPVVRVVPERVQLYDLPLQLRGSAVLSLFQPYTDIVFAVISEAPSMSL